jgi:hypothetical protein
MTDEKEADSDIAKRSALRNALADSAPGEDCKTLIGLKLVGGDATIVDLYKEIQYIAQSAQNHLAVASNIWKAITDLDPKDTEENLTKALNDEVKAGKEDFQHSLDEVKSAVAAPASTI